MDMPNRRRCRQRGCRRRIGKFLDPLLLLLLKERPTHGYALLGRLAPFGMDFLSPTVVYRALRDMADRGWIASYQDEQATQGPPRRVYALTPQGEEVLACCVTQMQQTKETLGDILELYGTLSAAEAGPPSTSTD
jgi:DNA-binding PadR family transcriptional regulator